MCDKESGVSYVVLIILNTLTTILIGFAWIYGVVLAKGFWMTLFSICLPFYGFYKITEKIASLTGLL